MENSKLKVIEFAYGENWEAVNQFIDENGWLKSNEISPFDLKLTWNDIEVREYAKNHATFRPKSLAGIEDNNGWISINSEDDLPKDNGHYLVFNKQNKSVDIDYIHCDYDSHSERWMEFNSHYQKIEKPLKPIFQ